MSADSHCGYLWCVLGCIFTFNCSNTGDYSAGLRMLKIAAFHKAGIGHPQASSIIQYYYKKKKILGTSSN